MGRFTSTRWFLLQGNACPRAESCEHSVEPVTAVPGPLRAPRSVVPSTLSYWSSQSPPMGDTDPDADPLAEARNRDPRPGRQRPESEVPAAVSRAGLAGPRARALTKPVAHSWRRTESRVLHVDGLCFGPRKELLAGTQPPAFSGNKEFIPVLGKMEPWWEAGSCSRLLCTWGLSGRSGH